MRHIKLFKEFINEQSQYIKNNQIKNNIYHATGSEISRLTKDPMWFALEKSHSDDGWFLNTINDTGKSFQYEATVTGKIGDISDLAVEKVFEEIGEDAVDWAIEIVGNPSAREVMNLPGTKALIKAGYDGIVYLDYDPRNFDDDLRALIVFNPAKSIKNFKLIKKYP